MCTWLSETPPSDRKGKNVLARKTLRFPKIVFYDEYRLGGVVENQNQLHFGGGGGAGWLTKYRSDSPELYQYQFNLFIFSLCMDADETSDARELFDRLRF